MNVQDVRKQAEWELAIERFEKAVEKEKARIKAKKRWFPWRFRLINLNKGK